MNLVGTYPVKVDNKGRLRLPSKLLEKLGDGGTLGQFYIARGVGKCLTLYTEEQWAQETNKLGKLDLNVVSNLIMVRDFFHDATDPKLDSADRISLSQLQMEATEIEDDAVIYTFLNRMEIWSKENYKNRKTLEIDAFGLQREQALVKKPNADE